MGAVCFIHAFLSLFTNFQQVEHNVDEHYELKHVLEREITQTSGTHSAP